MPNREIDLLIRCVRQNDGELSKRKRESWFQMLTDAEVKAIEKIISSNSHTSKTGRE
jgi:hypothetical protein